MVNATGEKAFQEHVIDNLTAHGWERGTDQHVNATLALYPPALLKFIQTTQPEAWEEFKQVHYMNPEEEFCELVTRTREDKGTLQLLREGVTKNGRTFTLLYAKPDSERNPQAVKNYQGNIFTVVDEVHYEVRDNPANRIDLVLFINGIPVVGAELKNELTGSTCEHGEIQWRKTRNPNEPLLKPYTGCLVYFSISNMEASFTTLLDRGTTQFHPFNKGYNYGPGNPPNDMDNMGHLTYYIWENVWSKDTLTDLIFNYLHIETKQQNGIPQPLREGRLIFPRYHQLNLIQTIQQDLKQDTLPYGTGGSFLIQHSAGSGKTKSIAWLAHTCAQLHDSNDNPVFGAVIVITDRQVVDTQLQNAVKGISKHAHQVGVVDKNSKQLAGYLNSGKRIIVSTVQKFSYIKDMLQEVQNRTGSKFAIIIDEAHSGQTGTHAANVRDILDQDPKDEGTLLDDLVQKDILPDPAVSSRGNLTFFAFTATPREETLARFAPNGKPYHLYSMKQAIKEHYILNVLDNYVTYDVIVKLIYSGEDGLLYNPDFARRALNIKIRSDEDTLTHKAQVVLDHMLLNVIDKLSGQGKGMIVASSRFEVYRWWKEIKSLVEANPIKYGRIKHLAAFTGTLDVPDMDERVSDKTLNGFDDTQIPTKFKQGEYNLLIVAQKFQTGFDAPPLVFMALDRSLSGVVAVQTLSRLNRTMVGKTGVSVLDFASNADNIREAFKRFHVESTLSEARTVSLDDLQSTARQVYSYGLFTTTEVEEYATALQGLAVNPEDKALARTARERFLPIVKRINDMKETDPRKLEQFKSSAKGYLGDYLFFIQFNRMRDAGLRNLHILLQDVLKHTIRPYKVDDEGWLDYVSIQRAGEHSQKEDFRNWNDEEPGTGFHTESSVTGKKKRKVRQRVFNLDEPISIKELVQSFNSRAILAYFGHDPNDEMVEIVTYSKTAEPGKTVLPMVQETDEETGRKRIFLTPAETERIMKEIENIALSIVKDEKLLELAQGNSFERFKRMAEEQYLDEAFVDVTREMVMARPTEDSGDITDLITKYSHEEPFKRILMEVLLECVYQENTNKQIHASRTAGAEGNEQ